MQKLLSVILLLLVLASCKTGKRAFEKGNYEEAVWQAIDRLRDDTDNKDASEILPQAYNLALQTARQQLKTEGNSNNPYKAENTADIYASLNAMSAEIQRCPACLKLVKPVFFTQEEKEASKLAADYRVKLAEGKLANKQNRNLSLSAVRDLRVAQKYQPNSPRVNALLQEAEYHATLNVVVRPLYLEDNFSFSYTNVLNQRLVDYLHQNNIPYVRFYTPQEAEANKLPWIDHEVVMHISYFAPQRNTFTDTYTLEKDSVLVKTRGGKETYQTVTANVVEKRVEITSKANLVVSIVPDNAKTPLRTEVLSNGYVWVDEWATYRGDEQALDDRAYELTRIKPQRAPNPEVLYRASTEPLYGKAVNFLSNFYRNY